MPRRKPANRHTEPPDNPWLPPDLVADRYLDEFYGSRLLRWKRGTASPYMREALLNAVWPRGSDGAGLFRVGGENQEDWIDLERDGFDLELAFEETRGWLQDTLIPRFIAEQEHKCGSLEAAVAAGRGRLLKRWVAWRFRDDLRKRWRVSVELALERELGSFLTRALRSHASESGRYGAPTLTCGRGRRQRASPPKSGRCWNYSGTATRTRTSASSSAAAGRRTFGSASNASITG